MRRVSIALLAAAGVLVVGSALADLVVLDGNGVSRIIKNFTCETTKLCNATVLIKSDGTELGTASQPVRTDPTGSTTQPVSGTVTSNLGTLNGAATAANQTAAAAAKGEGATGAAVPSGAQYCGMNVGGNLTGCAGLSAGADAVSNSSAQMLHGAFGYFYNGTTWDRMRGDTTNGLWVNVKNTLASVGNNADDVSAGASAASPVVAYNYVFDGTNWDRQRSPSLNACETNAQSYATGVITSATTTRIIAPSASNKTYLCAFFMKASAADNVAVVEGTGGTCGTGTAALLGGTTTANGFVFGTAGDGVLLQAGGKVAIVQTAGTNVDTCLITSTTGPLIWSAKYVQAP